tara:strand:+ start:934 stop:2130 length:1197 start_codon:yes stop_codon:yes gene_type:complete
MAIKIDGAKRKVKKAGKTSSSYGSTEPKWPDSEITGEEYSRLRRYAMHYYNMECKNTQYKKWTIEWIGKSEQWKEHIKAISKNPDNAFSAVLGGSCRMLTLGMPDQHQGFIEFWESQGGTIGTPPPITNFINKQLTKLLNNHIEAPKEKNKNPTANVPTIQDRMNEIANKHILHFELFEDKLMEGATVKDPKAFEYLKTQNCPQALIKKIAGFFEVHRQELIQARSGQDDQLKEGYSHYKAVDYKRFEMFYSKLFEDLDAYEKVKKATKKARVRKPPAKEKLVSKLKYNKGDDKLKIVSINPVDIIGASELWVYNVKNRKLGKYVKGSYDELGVKGTSIIGFSDNDSTQKTLRKPEVQLKELMKANKVQLRKFLSNIKTTAIKLNGRVNSDTILLKII